MQISTGTRTNCLSNRTTLADYVCTCDIKALCSPPTKVNFISLTSSNDDGVRLTRRFVEMLAIFKDNGLYSLSTQELHISFFAIFSLQCVEIY